MSKVPQEVVKLLKDNVPHRKIAKQFWVWTWTVSRRRQECWLGVKFLASWNIEENKWVNNICINWVPVNKVIPDYELWDRAERKPIKSVNYRNWEVEIDDELSALDKALEKLEQKYWVQISVNKNWLPVYQRNRIEPYRWWNKDNVLVISDIHAPYILDGYLDFCRNIQEKFDIGTIVYIWDIIDFHSISFHTKCPEELNPAWELAKARAILQDWYYTFPEAIVTLWNHDKLPRRQAQALWLPRELIQNENVVFQAPSTYKFVEEVIIDNVLYTHWNTSNAFKKCILENMNMVSGHAHTQCGIMYHQNRHWKLFWMQVWVGIDYKSKAFDYAKSNSKHPVSACWVVLNSWTLPIIIPYDISSK